MEIQRMTVWQSASGRIHAYWQCSAAGPKSLQKRIKVTAEQYDAATRCRCLRGWKTSKVGTR